MNNDLFFMLNAPVAPAATPQPNPFQNPAMNFNPFGLQQPQQGMSSQLAKAQPFAMPINAAQQFTPPLPRAAPVPPPPAAPAYEHKPKIPANAFDDLFN
jgi:hypothetical protein